MLQETHNLQAYTTRLEVFTAINIQVVVFWVVTSCSVVVGYQCFGETCCLYLQRDAQERDRGSVCPAPC
jgi:hypothetical protein